MPGEIKVLGLDLPVAWKGLGGGALRMKSWPWPQNDNGDDCDGSDDDDASAAADDDDDDDDDDNDDDDDDDDDTGILSVITIFFNWSSSAR